MTDASWGFRQKARMFAAVYSCLGAIGCAVGPDYRTPLLSLPGQWSAADAKGPRKTAGLARWWMRLDDPLLNALIQEAGESNLDVATAKAKIRDARATARRSSAALSPSLTGSGSAEQARSAVVQGISSDSASQIQEGFDASWEIDLFGANRRGAEAATREVEATEDDLQNTLVTLLGDVASYYIDARAAQARAALARRSVASQRKTASLTKAKFEAGSAVAADVANAEAQASNTEANIPNYESTFATDLHRLSVLVGRDPDALAKRLAKAAPIPAPRGELSRGIPASVLVARPDVRAAERRLAESTASVGKAEAGLYPSITLTGPITTTGQRLGDLAKYSSVAWSLGPSVTIPLFDGGKLRAAVALAKAERDANFSAYRAAVLKALEDVENAVVSLAGERRRTASLADSAKNYRQASELSQALYDNGSSSFLDVLDAERSLYSAEDSLLQSRASVAKDYVALAKALGGGWDGAVDSAKPEVVDADVGPRLASPQ